MATSTTKAIRSLRERALGLLARREHTPLELRRKLMRIAIHADANAEPDEAAAFAQADAGIDLESEIDALIADFQQRGWLSESRFAEQAVSAKQKKYGSLRIAHELREKGVSEPLVEQAMAQVKTDELANARAIHHKKYKAQPANREEWAKQARFLQSRGFGFDIIKQVLNSQDDA